MKRTKFLAMLCALSLFCMNVVTVAPSLAEASKGDAAQAQSELAANKKKKKSEQGDNGGGLSKSKDQSAAKTPKPTKKPKATKTPKPTKAPKATKEPKATKTPKPTKEPKATKTPKPTKKPKATEEPEQAEATEAPEQAEPTPAPEATEAPEQAEPTPAPEATEAPEQAEPTPAPEATEAPGEIELPEATEAPEATKAPEVTEAPVEIATPEPTKAPKLKLKGLKPDKAEVAPGKAVKFTLTVENAETVVWNAQRSDGENGGSGKVKGGAFSWKPKATGVYTVTVNATAGDKTASDSCVVIVRAAKLEVATEPANDYAQQGGEKLKYNISVTGGCEPYTMSIVVKHKGEKIFTSEEVLKKVTCDAVGYGNNHLTVTVTDAAGDTVKAKATILSASNERNEAPALPKLTDDMTFADKLLAVAKSQLGYRESAENFILRDDLPQGWSFYGGWYGAPYDEWCAMFVSYCLVKAGISNDIMPNNGNCNRWKSDLAERYIDDEDAYIPEPGDIIFFHHDRVSKDPNYPNHIGIVTGYDADTDTVYTVEGNSGKSVRARQYERSSSVIVGYVSLRACMVEHDPVYRAQLGDQLASNLECFRAQYADKN